MPAELSLEAFSPSSEDEIYEFLARVEKRNGITHRNPRFWRTRNSIRFGYGWAFRDTAGIVAIGVVGVPGTEPHSGSIAFEVIDFEDAPEKCGLNCLGQPAVMVQTALMAAQTSPVRMLWTSCHPSHQAYQPLLDLGGICDADTPHILRFPTDSIIKAASELKQHCCLTETKTTGKSGSAIINVEKAGILFGYAYQPVVNALARGDLSSLGHNTIFLRRNGNRKAPSVCAA